MRRCRQHGRSFNIGAGSYLAAVTYSVNITAFSPSVLSEAALAFTDAAVTNGVLLTPGFGVDASVTATYAGTVDPVGEGLDFAVGTEGFLRLEWFEDFAYASVNPDAIWNVSVAWGPRIMQLVRSADLPAASSSRA